MISVLLLVVINYQKKPSIRWKTFNISSMFGFSRIKNSVFRLADTNPIVFGSW